MTRIGVTTGCFYQLEYTFEEIFALLAERDVEGVEISFTDWEEVRNVEPERWPDLSDMFEFVTLHAPIKEPVTEDNLTMVAAMERIRQAVGARVIVVHPPKLPSLEAVTSRATVAVENMQRRKEFDHDDLARFLGDWQGPIVLDTCHAATWGDEELERLFERYGDRCSHVHLSAHGDEEHERMVEHPGFMEQVASRVAGHDIVLEHRLDSLDELDEELAFVTDQLE